MSPGLAFLLGLIPGVGAIYNEGDLTLENSTISGNLAETVFSFGTAGGGIDDQLARDVALVGKFTKDVVEGLRCLDVPAFSVQYHPEAAAGPHDSAYLFDRFCELMEDARAQA